MNIGEKTLDWLYRSQLQIDREWAVKTETGFTWWAHRHAQTIEIVGEATTGDGDTAALVCARTEVLRKMANPQRTAEALKDGFMRRASMSGPVLDPERGTLALSSAVWIHQRKCSWMPALLSTAVVLQLAEAEQLAGQLAAACRAEPATCGHPETGIRPTPHPTARLVAQLFIPAGVMPCKWPAEEFEGVFHTCLQHPPSVRAALGGLGFIVEFLSGEVSSQMQATGDFSHVSYGNGLHLRQSFPTRHLSPVEGADLALRLNAVELTRRPTGYGFGSYWHSGDQLHFATFLPNACYRPGLLVGLYFAAAERARAMPGLLLETGWEGASQRATAGTSVSPRSRTPTYGVSRA